MRFFLTDKEVNIATFTVLKSGLPPNTTFLGRRTPLC